jgi:hypothetical protein
VKSVREGRGLATGGVKKSGRKSAVPVAEIMVTQTPCLFQCLDSRPELSHL